MYYSGGTLQPRREKSCDATTATTKEHQLPEVCASDPGLHRIPHQDTAGKGPGGWKHPVKAQPHSSIISSICSGLCVDRNGATALWSGQCWASLQACGNVLSPNMLHFFFLGGGATVCNRMAKGAVGLSWSSAWCQWWGL